MGILKFLGPLAGAALGSVVPGVGTALGASLGGALGGAATGSGGAIFGSGPKATQMPFSQTNNGSSNSTFTGNTSGTQTPIAPPGYLEALLGMQPGQGGYNPTQQTGVDWYTKMMGQGVPGLDNATNYFQDTLNNRQAPTLRNLEAIDPSAYATPGAVSAQNVTAQQGSKFMDAYRNPYEDQVVQSALSDLERQFGVTKNASNMQQAASGAFGGGRHGLREAQMADDYLRTVGATSGGLRAQGFNTAAGLGMQDAGRVLQADASNADRALSASTFNNEQQQQRNMFDANLGMQYNDQRDKTAQTLAQLGVMGLGVNQDMADSLFNMGGTGQNQNLAWLQQFGPLFGQQNTGSSSGTESGTTTGNTSGYNTQIQPGSGGIVGSLGPILAGLGELGWNPFGKEKAA